MIIIPKKNYMKSFTLEIWMKFTLGLFLIFGAVSKRKLHTKIFPNTYPK